VTSPGFCTACGMAAGPEALRCAHCGALLPAGDGLTDPRRVARELGEALGAGYEVVEELGRGGFARVFRVHDLTLDRWLAAKVIAPELTASAEASQRFRNEAMTVARLVHPNIVPIYFVPSTVTLATYVMPLVSGESLAARLGREGPLPLIVAVGIVQDVAAALDVAHTAGVVHRDVKPDNILLEAESGRALLTDFGIAHGPRASGRITISGQVLGTPRYIAPEQAAGEREPDGRSDVYALGVVAFEMLAGRPPYDAANAQALFAQHVAAECPDLRQWRPDASAAVAASLKRAMAKDPADRFATAGAFAHALAAGLGRRSLRVSGATVVGHVGAGEVGLFRTTTAADVPDAGAAVRTAGDLGELRDGIAAVQGVIARAVWGGDVRRAAEAVATLAAGARDARPAFRREAASALQTSGKDPAVIEALARLWVRAEPGSQAAAEEALVSLMPDAAPPLLALARRERRADLVLLADRTGALGEAEAMALARDASPGIASLLLGALVESQRPPDVVERWLAAALRHQHADVRRAALAAAVQRGCALAERLGRTGLGDRDPAVRIVAIDALGASGRKEAVPDLARVLQSSGAEEQVRAAQALGEIGLPEAAIALERSTGRRRVLFFRPSPAEQAALDALARMRSESATAALGRIASRAGPVQELARAALERRAASTQTPG